jgi:hypothetical protein
MASNDIFCASTISSKAQAPDRAKLTTVLRHDGELKERIKLYLAQGVIVCAFLARSSCLTHNRSRQEKKA